MTNNVDRKGQYQRPVSNRRKRPPQKSRKERVMGGANRAVKILASFKLRAAIFALLALATLGGYQGYRVLVYSNVFAITEIQVVGQRTDSVQATEERLKVLIGTNIYRLKLKEVSNLVEEDPWISKAEVKRHHSNQLRVDIKTRIAKAAVYLNGLYLVDAQGLIFKRTQSSADELENLTIISGLDRSSALAEPELFKEHILKALAVLDLYASESKRPKLSDIFIDSVKGFTLTTYEGASMVQLGTGDLQFVEKKLLVFDQAWQALPPDDQMAVKLMRVASDGSRVTVAFNES